MSKFVVKCNGCGFELDVKWKSRFDKIRINTYLCKDCILQNKIRLCSKCGNQIFYQSPFSKKKADELNSICKACCSNQIPQQLTQEQSEFINGLLLGDASIVYGNKHKSLYPRLTLSRKEEDKDYLLWQFDLLKEFYSTAPTHKSQIDNRTNKEYHQYHLQTKSGKVFADCYQKWYPNGIKIVPKDVKLTPLTLLIWFLDDGSIVRSSKNGLTIKFATDGFLKEDVVYLASLLKDYLDETFNIYKNNNGFILKASTMPAMKFIQAIEPIYPQCMQRKRTWRDFDFRYVNNSNYFGAMHLNVEKMSSSPSMSICNNTKN